MSRQPLARSVVGLCVVAVLAGSLWLPVTAQAEIKPEHRKELMEIKKELNKVAGLITKKETDEAEKILTDSETKLKALCTSAGIQETDKFVLGTFKLIEQKRTAITRKTGATAGGASFEKDVAPILVKNCLNCHGTDNPRGSLNMSTFAGIVAGGDTGKIIVPGNAAASSIVRKINLTGQGKMPPGNRSMTPDEIKTITGWVQSGAKFTGDNNTPIRDLASTTPGAAPMMIEIPKPTGNETVSFTKDIAPWFVRLCGNCHGGNNPRSGFSVATFEGIMKGGNSGRVLLPGNRKDSRLWDLVGEQDPIKMPPGQALITETNWENLKTWIDEGCKFDGQDPKAPLASLIPSAANEKAKELAARSPAAWDQARRDETEALWKAFTKDEMKLVETKQFLVAGDVGEARLKQVGEWAETQAKLLAQMFQIKEDPMWKGRLTIFVIKEPFGFDEFTQINDGRPRDKEQFGFARVNPTQERAYVVVQDIGDNPTEESPGMRAMVIENLTVAAVLRSGRRPADWVSRGLGLLLASRAEPKNVYFKAAPGQAAKAVDTLTQPLDLFNDGTFSVADHAAVSYSLVGHLVGGAGDAAFLKFIGSLMGGNSLNEALRTVYSADTQVIYNTFTASVKSAKSVKSKKN